MNNHTAKTVNFDYRERALEFKVGDTVSPLGVQTAPGRVTAVWPAIGMVDVEWTTGHKRCPVEDLVLLVEGKALPTSKDNTPGGPAFHPGEGHRQASVERVAKAWAKQSIYWAARDRKYKATKPEIAGGSYNCPRCKDDALRRTSYKRMEGKSVKLMACPSCLFVIRVKDLLGCHFNTGCDDPTEVL